MKKLLLISLLLIGFIVNGQEKSGFKLVADTIWMSDYFEEYDEDLKIISITQSVGSVTLIGEDRSKQLEQYIVYFDGGNNVYSLFQYDFGSISLITVPFKNRFKSDTLSSNVEAGLSNVGLNLAPWNWTWARYFSSGESAIHKLSIGTILTPAAVELTSKNTGGKIEDDITQLFISIGPSITYSYNSLTFSFIPFGYDIPLTEEGKEFKQKQWLGFGLGIKFNSFIPSKN